jgi:hypothetical protein
MCYFLGYTHSCLSNLKITPQEICIWSNCVCHSNLSACLGRYTDVPFLLSTILQSSYISELSFSFFFSRGYISELLDVTGDKLWSRRFYCLKSTLFMHNFRGQTIVICLVDVLAYICFGKQIGGWAFALDQSQSPRCRSYDCQ